MSKQETLTPRVFIIRHGETKWSKLGRATGTTELQLTLGGVKQVSTAAATLVGNHKLLDPSRLTHIFVSPRLRTKETFELFLGSSNVTTEKVTYTEDIAEWNYGEYEGCTDREIRDSRRLKGLDKDREWDILSDGCENGESMQQVTERLDRLIAKIRGIQEPYMRGETPADILLVAHGLILRCLWKRWQGLSINFPLRMMLDPGEFAILGYKGVDINKPAFHLGVQLPSGPGC